MTIHSSDYPSRLKMYLVEQTHRCTDETKVFDLRDSPIDLETSLIILPDVHCAFGLETITINAAKNKTAKVIKWVYSKPHDLDEIVNELHGLMLSSIPNSTIPVPRFYDFDDGRKVSFHTIIPEYLVDGYRLFRQLDTGKPPERVRTTYDIKPDRHTKYTLAVKVDSIKWKVRERTWSYVLILYSIYV